MQPFIRLFLIISLFFMSFSLHADSAFMHQKNVQKFINDMVKHHGFSRKQMNDIMSQVVVQPKVLESMNKPYEKKNWDTYRELFLTPNRLMEGLKFWNENKEALEKAEKKYGVPAHVIVAILGVETQYGKYQGNYRVLDALSTLAFYYPARSPFFTKELKEFLLLCREQKVPPTQYMGSYAGAIGKPQFMPSSYRYYAVDFTGNGHKDLINDNNDVIGSVANYFNKHGWKMHDGVVQPASFNGDRPKQIQTNPKYANYRLNQLQAAGIKATTAALHPPLKAGLIELVTQQGKEYWIAYPNFFVITRYNSSPQYAMVVYLLSQQLKMERAHAMTKRIHAYA